MNVLKTNLELIMKKWIENSLTNFSGGRMRVDRGEDIEQFVLDSINFLGKPNVYAKRGIFDKKDLKITVGDREIVKSHQIDIHVYKNDVFYAVVECKAYLDSCYYVRACDDFKLFRRFDYNLKNYVFALEDCIDIDTKLFTDYVSENICDGVFYMLDGKRSSARPIYNEKFKKEINFQNFQNFFETIIN